MLTPNPLASWTIDETHPTQPSPSEFFASLRAVHATAEVERAESAKLHDRLSAQETATMQEMIKHMEAEKAALEAQNTALKVMSEAATAAKDAAEAAAEAAASGSLSSSRSASTAKALADAVAKAAAGAATEKSAKEYTYPCSIALPVWPVFDLSVQFNKTDTAYVNSHVRALVWCKVWQVVKEHFKSVHNEYTHSLYNAIMKVHISPIADKDAAAHTGHLFHNADSSKGIALTNPLALKKAVHVNASVKWEAHADQVHCMVVHTFTEFLNMMVIKKAHVTKHSEYVQWHPVPYLHAEVVHKIREAIAAGSGSRDAASSCLIPSPTMHTAVPAALLRRGWHISSCSALMSCMSCCSRCLSDSSLLC